MDYCAKNETPSVKRRLKKYSEHHLQVTPTGAVCPNKVEHVCADLTEKQLHRCVFTNVPSLGIAELDHIDVRNDYAKPVAQTADADSIRRRIVKNGAVMANCGE